MNNEIVLFETIDKEIKLNVLSLGVGQIRSQNNTLEGYLTISCSSTRCE